MLKQVQELRKMAKLEQSRAMAAGREWPRATEIIPDFLWLGDEDDAIDSPWLERMGITHVLNCASRTETGRQCSLMKTLQCLELNAEDAPGYDLFGNHMEAALTFLDAAASKRSPRVLVHCVAGVNRSAAIVVAFLMARGFSGGRGPASEDSMPLIDAIRHVFEHRPIVLSNDCFLRQLVKLEMERR